MEVVGGREQEAARGSLRSGPSSDMSATEGWAASADGGPVTGPSRSSIEWIWMSISISDDQMMELLVFGRRVERACLDQR